MTTAPSPSPPPIPADAAHPQSPLRQHRRVAIRMSAEIHVESSGGTTAMTATTRDLSEGGVGVDLPQLIAEGVLATVGLFMVVDDVEEERVPPLWVRARVVWSGELDNGRAVAGLRFEVITEAQKQWLRQLLRNLTP